MEKISSKNNPLAIHYRKLGTSSNYREKSGEFLCEGEKLLLDALDSDIEVSSILTASHVEVPLSVDTKVYYCEQKLIDSISTLTTAQETLFACKSRTMEPRNFLTGVHLLLDEVQDPGNVGTIMRTANAFGIESIILTKGCADPYNPKTIRASMGAIFRQDFYVKSFEELQDMESSGATFLGAVLEDTNMNIGEIGGFESIIVIGNESRGISSEILSLCKKRVNIPISPSSDSLNAAIAAAIIIWEAAGRIGNREEE
ncbi:MAG: RNA methyltransferase [Oscillospiraceae bacterium]|nr:RNA methyltransferase [Oscillospiraceae bacterium]